MFIKGLFHNPISQFIFSCLEFGQFKEAQFAAERLLGEVNSEENIYLLALCFFRQGYMEQALNLLVNADIKLPESKVLLAQCYAALRDYQVGITTLIGVGQRINLNEIVVIYGKYASFVCQLIGELYLKASNTTEAEKYLKKSLDLNPLHWISYSHLTDIGVRLSSNKVFKEKESSEVLKELNNSNENVNINVPNSENTSNLDSLGSIMTSSGDISNYKSNETINSFSYNTSINSVDMTFENSDNDVENTNHTKRFPIRINHLASSKSNQNKRVSFDPKQFSTPKLSVREKLREKNSSLQTQSGGDNNPLNKLTTDHITESYRLYIRLLQHLGAMYGSLRQCKMDDVISLSRKLSKGQYETGLITSWISIAYCEINEVNEAYRISKSSILQDEYNMDNAAVLSVILFRMKQTTKLAQLSKKLDSLSQKWTAEQHFVRGNLLSMINRKDEAVKCYKNALTINNFYVPAHIALINEYILNESYELAYFHINSILFFQPTNAKARLCRVYLNRLYGEDKQSEISIKLLYKEYKSSLQVIVHYVDYLYNKASMNSLNEGLSILNTAIINYPRCSLALNLKADILFRLGYYRSSIKLYHQVESLLVEKDTKLFRKMATNYGHLYDDTRRLEYEMKAHDLSPCALKGMINQTVAFSADISSANEESSWSNRDDDDAHDDDDDDDDDVYDDDDDDDDEDNVVIVRYTNENEN